MIRASRLLFAPHSLRPFGGDATRAAAEAAWKDFRKDAKDVPKQAEKSFNSVNLLNVNESDPKVKEGLKNFAKTVSRPKSHIPDQQKRKMSMVPGDKDYRSEKDKSVTHLWKSEPEAMERRKGIETEVENVKELKDGAKKNLKEPYTVDKKTQHRDDAAYKTIIPDILPREDKMPPRPNLPRSPNDAEPSRDVMPSEQKTYLSPELAAAALKEKMKTNGLESFDGVKKAAEAKGKQARMKVEDVTARMKENASVNDEEIRKKAESAMQESKAAASDIAGAGKEVFEFAKEATANGAELLSEKLKRAGEALRKNVKKAVGVKDV